MTADPIDLPTSYETPRLVVRQYRAEDSAWYWRAGQRNRDHLAAYETGNPIRGLGSEEEARTLHFGLLRSEWVK